MSKYLGAVGIAVSDLERSSAFYTKILGMVELRRLELESMDEIILGFEGSRSASVVLMKYTDGSDHNCQDLPVKLVFFVDDTRGILEAVRASGYTIYKEAQEYPSMGGMIIGYAKDPDGYKVELMQKPPKK